MSLISVADLAAELGDPDLRVADVRWSLAVPGGGRAAYATAHLPGAVFVDLETMLTAPEGPGRHPLPDPAAFAAALAALGIGRGHRVVAYDDAGGTVAARLWWMLDALGHAHVAVLDGGLGAWRDAGLPLTASVPAHAPAEPVATPGPGVDWPRTIDGPTLAARLRRVRILDARAPERYRGEIEPIDRIPGHIPTAVSLPTSELLRGDGRFLAPDELAARFAVVGVAGRSGADSAARSVVGAVNAGGPRGAAAAVGAEVGPVVVSCGSGVNACQLALAMREAGLPDPLLYPGSYSDWTRSRMPIAVGAEPGEPPNPPPQRDIGRVTAR
jgi:thiosulfate/3-mercaptopyruvate sulfurtransferase